MIEKLELENFTCFRNLTMDFSPKINVIIGENGTGKTQLLKVAYFLCNLGSLAQNQQQKEARELLTEKLLRVFKPLNQDLSQLRQRNADGKAQITSHFASGEQTTLSFNYNSKWVVLQSPGEYTSYKRVPILIPTKEVLSFIQGINHPDADQATLERTFDDVYLALCAQLAAEPLPIEDKQERLHFDPRFGSILPKLVNTIGGKYEFLNGDFYFHQGSYVEQPAKDRPKGSDKFETVFKENRHSKRSNTMTAEGFRKIGILQQLLINGTLDPGISGPLLWDEPEANMNPKLMRTLVEVLFELARSGQQIILATHDYVLLKWFDLLTDKNKEDHVQFHSLYHDVTSGAVQLESCDKFQLLNQNAISDSFAEIYDEEIQRALG